jgi:hypothetical protein
MKEVTTDFADYTDFSEAHAKARSGQGAKAERKISCSSLRPGPFAPWCELLILKSAQSAKSADNSLLE